MLKSVHGPGVDTALQNGLMALGWGSIFAALVSSKRLRRLLPALMIGSAVAILVNLLYDSLIYFPWAMSVALFFRLAPGFESCWLICYRRDEWRWALVGMAGVLVYSCTNPQAVSVYGRITVSALATIGMTAVCLATCAVQRSHIVENGSIEVRNLHLQTAWMVIQSAMYMGAKWITQTWERRYVVRWAYVAAALVIAFLYHRLFTRRAGQEGACPECPPEPEGPGSSSKP